MVMVSGLETVKTQNITVWRAHGYDGYDMISDIGSDNRIIIVENSLCMTCFMVPESASG